MPSPGWSDAGLRATGQEPVQSGMEGSFQLGGREQGGFFVFVFVFLLFRAAPMTYGSSQARG